MYHEDYQWDRESGSPEERCPVRKDAKEWHEESVRDPAFCVPLDNAEGASTPAHLHGEVGPEHEGKVDEQGSDGAEGECILWKHAGECHDGWQEVRGGEAVVDEQKRGVKVGLSLRPIEKNWTRGGGVQCA